MRVNYCLLPFLLSVVCTRKVIPLNKFILKSVEELFAPALIEASCVVLLDETPPALKDFNLHWNKTYVSIIHITKSASVETGNTWPILVEAMNQNCCTIIMSIRDMCGAFEHIYKCSEASIQRKNRKFIILVQDNEVSLGDYVTCDLVKFFPLTDIIIVRNMTQSKYRNVTGLISHILKDDFEQAREIQIHKFSHENYEINKLFNFSGVIPTMVLFSYSPFALYDKDSCSGFDYITLVEFSKIHNFTWKVEAATLWGSFSDNDTTDSLFGKLKNINYHIGTPAVFLTYNRYQHFDYGFAHSESIVKFLVPIPRPKKDLWAIFSPFTIEVWVALFAYILLGSLILFLCSFVQKFVLKKYYNNPFSEYIYSILYMISISVGFSIPNKGQGAVKHLIVSLFMTSLVMITAYSCNLVSYLTYPLHESPINTLDELLISGLKWGSDALYWSDSFRESSKHVVQMINERRVDTQQSKALNNLVESGRLAVPVEYYPSGCTFAIDFLSDNALSRLRVMRENAFGLPIAFLFHRNSPLVPFFNKFIAHLSGSGILLYWQRDYSRNIIGQHYRSTINSIRSLELKDLDGAFIFLLIGFFGSVTIFTIEIVFGWFKLLISKVKLRKVCTNLS